jgi:regulator of protease activity HflC (stomatin/prohibitin superfamily)
VVEQGAVGLISRFGRYYKSVDPGLVRINVFTEKLRQIDIKMQIEDIPQQFVMTKDNVFVQIGGYLCFKLEGRY